MPKVKCYFHEDNTASMELYADGYYHCFGCNAHGLIGSLPVELQGDLEYKYHAILPKEKENLEESIKFIEGLSKAQIRGFDLPTDGVSYYIVWPDRSFYNRRFLEVEEHKSKYKCPTGHAKRLFVANATGTGPLAIVEGELNALSFARAFPWLSVVSPGGAGDFHSKHALGTYLETYKKYAPVYLFADEDKAGAIGCIELAAKLKPHVPQVTICLLKQDFNDLLMTRGKESIVEEVQKRVGLSAWVQDR